MDSASIRQTYLDYFERNGHTRVESASLVPASFDPSVLLTTAGMQPFKPYFLGQAQPPANRLTSCQRVFRTTDIDQIGTTARHLTYFEMLGNFSFGDYFKEEAIRFGWELSVEGFGFDPELIWVTVFAGDDELGLGPDEEAIEIWRGVGVPERRIVRLPRSENFWQAGPTGPAGPCSEMYLDRGEAFGSADERPGDDTDRFIEYWNHVFMALELAEDGSTSELPKRSIDTGMGLERMAAILQDVESVFEADGFRPLISLCEELSGAKYGSSPQTVRSMRILADHSRGMVQLIADGVVPSNEDRGYILRRIMRRAIQHGRRLGVEGEFLQRFADRAIELSAGAYPHLERERATIERWVGAEEESFGRTLDRGTALLDRVVAEAREAGAGEVAAEDAFKLHDTYGFPFELTQELAGEQGLGVDQERFAVLMEGQRERARAAGGRHAEAGDDAVAALLDRAPPTEFIGYEQLEASTAIAAAAPADGEFLVKLEASPFYAEGGGQVADSGTVAWNGHEANVTGVTRAGEDQVVHLDAAAGTPGEGDRVDCTVDRVTRHATMRNHTATHLLHAALRERLGEHVRQAGSAVRPDKLRFDFTHSEPLSAEDREAIAARINGWIKQSLPVRWIEMDRAQAEELGAMALFGEKYGDWVRVVEVEEVSRELCGGTHVSNTAEIGLFEIVAEGSSAANVRRIEAVTGPAAIDLVAERTRQLREAAQNLGDDDVVAASRRVRERIAELEGLATEQAQRRAESQLDELADKAQEAGGVTYVVARAEGSAKTLLELAGKLRHRLGESSAVVLGSADGGKVALAGVFGDGATGRGLSAADVVGRAAGVVGGGGGGRANVAQAGGRDPAKLDEALEGAATDLTRALQT